jgi:outer membrane protein OmpA-like peptidoglycan-associated protein
MPSRRRSLPYRRGASRRRQMSGLWRLRSRRGHLYRGSRPVPLLPAALAIPLAVGALAVVAIHAGAAKHPPAPRACLAVAATPSANEMQPALPPAVRGALMRVGASDGLATVMLGDGDGTVTESQVDLTPRRPNGEEEQVPDERRRRINGEVAAIDQLLRRARATHPGHDYLALAQQLGRTACRSAALITSGIDTRAPLNMRISGFDEPVRRITHFLRALNTLPRLQGRTIFLAMTPPAGLQPALTEPVRRQLQSQVVGVLTAAGAQVHVVAVASGGPPLSTVNVPPVPVPRLPSLPPMPRRPPCRPPVTQDIRLSAAAFFVVNMAELLDRHAAVASLRPLATRARSAGVARIDITGHTSLDAEGYGAGGPLSLHRALRIRQLLLQLHVPAWKIHRVRGVGPRQPVVQPPSNPKNRVVVVSLRYRPRVPRHRCPA